MTYGLGCLPSPADPRDFLVEALYDQLGAAPPAHIPDTYRVRGRLPAVLDQGSSPMCVAYSSAAMKAWQDHRDQGVWFDFDKVEFFHEIGGTQQGAMIRSAMEQMLKVGYPTRKGRAERHQIAAYYRVGVERERLQRALLTLGPILLSVEWAHSWFRPGTGGLLPPWDSSAGGHAIMAIGWTVRGLRLRNSWGDAWGRGGNCTLPWEALTHVREGWKSYDERVGGR